MADPRFLNPVTVLADIGGVSIDVTTRVGEVYNNIITQNPIETGSPTTDHVINEPPRVTLEGGFSDMRISKLVGPVVTQEATRGRAKTEFDKLLDLYTQRKPFLLMDGFHLFKDMQFKTLTLEKDRPGFSIFFTAEIWNIVVVGIDESAKSIQSKEDSRNRLKVSAQGVLPVGGVPSKTSILPPGVLL